MPCSRYVDGGIRRMAGGVLHRPDVPQLKVLGRVGDTAYPTEIRILLLKAVGERTSIVDGECAPPASPPEGGPQGRLVSLPDPIMHVE